MLPRREELRVNGYLNQIDWFFLFRGGAVSIIHIIRSSGAAAQVVRSATVVAVAATSTSPAPTHSYLYKYHFMATSHLHIVF